MNIKDTMNGILSAVESARLVEELAKVKKDDLQDLFDAITQGDVKATALINTGFEWGESIYGAPYWNKIFNKVAEKEPASVVQSMKFDKFQDKLEENLKSLGYRRVSLHADDKHRYRSKEQLVTVHTEGGYINIDSTKFTINKLLVRSLSRVEVLQRSIILHTQVGFTVVIRE